MIAETQRLVQGGRLSAPQLLGGGTTAVSELLAVQCSAIPLFDYFNSDGSTIALAGTQTVWHGGAGMGQAHWGGACCLIGALTGAFWPCQ